MAMKENKGQRKQTKDKRIFLWLRDDGAVEAQSHSTGKVRVQSRPVVHIPANKISNRLGQQTRSRPRRGLSGIASIVEAAAHPNADLIGGRLIVEKHPINRAVDGRRADGDGRRVGGAGGKSLRSSAAGNPLSYRFHVCRVGAGKEGRERDLRVGREVILVNFAGGLPAIGAGVRSRGSS